MQASDKVFERMMGILREMALGWDWVRISASLDGVWVG